MYVHSNISSSLIQCSVQLSCNTNMMPSFLACTRCWSSLQSVTPDMLPRRAERGSCPLFCWAQQEDRARCSAAVSQQSSSDGGRLAPHSLAPSIKMEEALCAARSLPPRVARL
jgi:hypothetical protein